MTTKRSNKCPNCGKLHAFSIMDAEEAQLYAAEELPTSDDVKNDEYLIYICPEQEERVIVLVAKEGGEHGNEG